LLKGVRDEARAENFRPIAVRTRRMVAPIPSARSRRV